MHSFPQFSGLPTEIRLKIWQLTVRPRRIIWTNSYHWPKKPLCFDNPAVHANQEATVEILKEYTFFSEPNPLGLVGIGMHINFNIDTLCLAEGSRIFDSLLASDNPVLEGLRWLEIDPSPGGWLYTHIPKIRNYENLELIIIKFVVDPSVDLEQPGEISKNHFARFIKRNDTNTSHLLDESVGDIKRSHIDTRFIQNIPQTIFELARCLGLLKDSGNSDLHLGRAKLAVMFTPAFAQFQDEWIMHNVTLSDPIIDHELDKDVWEVFERYLGNMTRDYAEKDGWYIRQVRKAW